MKFIFSGGGTGGHIYPAITLIENIKERQPQAQILYVGTKKGLEADIVPRKGIPFQTIDIEGFKRRLTAENLVVLGKALLGVAKSFKILLADRPSAVIGTGGYVSGPLLLAAALLHIPTLIQDQNAIPGITNKILSKFVDKIACGYQSSCAHFSAKKAVFTGNPIRKDVFKYSRQQAIRELGLSMDKKTVLVTGGSRGARRINKAMPAVYAKFANNEQIQFLHVTGRTQYDEVFADLKDHEINLAKINNVYIKPYLYDMPMALAAADLVISRAGAIGLAEITASGLPAILVPYPYAAEDHQRLNAQALVDKKAASMIPDAQLTGERLLTELEGLLNTKECLRQMAKHSKKMGRPEATDEITRMILQMVRI